MWTARRIETIDFHTFMEGKTRTDKNSKPSLLAYSFIPLNPAAMIDPVFISIAAGVLLVALIEKGLADSGNVSIAAFLSAFLKISFPIAGLTAIWFLMTQLKFLF